MVWKRVMEGQNTKVKCEGAQGDDESKKRVCKLLSSWEMEVKFDPRLVRESQLIYTILSSVCFEHHQL